MTGEWTHDAIKTNKQHLPLISLCFDSHFNALPMRMSVKPMTSLKERRRPLEKEKRTNNNNEETPSSLPLLLVLYHNETTSCEGSINVFSDRSDAGVSRSCLLYGAIISYGLRCSNPVALDADEDPVSTVWFDAVFFERRSWQPHGHRRGPAAPRCVCVVTQTAGWNRILPGTKWLSVYSEKNRSLLKMAAASSKAVQVQIPIGYQY